MVQIMAFYTCTKVREGSLEIKICQVPDNKDNDWCHNELKTTITICNYNERTCHVYSLSEMAKLQKPTSACT